MLEQLMKLYVMMMAGDVRSPLPHLVGPPGTGKSTVIEELARLLKVNLHTLNVSRISPLELEGVQMPVPDSEENLRLKLLHATFWTDLKDGDILLLDEFLRGFPEVYNGLLDILTSRNVGGMRLPKVFIIGASNSVTTYDKALEDRLLNIPVPDLRHSRKLRLEAAQRLVDELGLHPDMVTSTEMDDLIRDEVLPMYDVLDTFKPGAAATGRVSGHSLRNLIGQAKLRTVQSAALGELIAHNNRVALNSGKVQYMFLLSGVGVDPKYIKLAKKLVGNDKLTPIQALNLQLNLQLVELETSRLASTRKDDDDDANDPVDADIFDDL